MDIKGYSPEQLKAMREAASWWIRNNVFEINRCVATFRSINLERETFEKSLTKRRVEKKIISDMEANRIPPMFSHTIKDMIFNATLEAACNPKTILK